jgi:quinol monooxygenase YgiN
VSVHFIVRFEPRPGMAAAFRDASQQVMAASREEEGCVAFNVFESLHEPTTFAIHSEWADEAAFDIHAELPHTLRFLQAADELLTHPVQGLRSRWIGGGPGRNASPA